MNENVRLEAGSIDLYRMKYILGKNEGLAGKTGLNGTKLATLTNAPDVMKAALKAAKRCDTPIRFIVILDQVGLYKYNLEDLNDLMSDNNLHKS